MSIDDRRSNPLLQPDIAEQNMRGMAECMDMVRQELIQAGIVEATVPPMMVANAVVKYMLIQNEAAKAEAKFADEMHDRAKNAEAEIESLKTELIASYGSRAGLIELCQGIAKALGRPETALEGFDKDELIGLAQHVKAEAQRFAVVRAVARTMKEDGGEQALLEAVEEYRAEHGT
jgi:hypothetical protein